MDTGLSEKTFILKYEKYLFIGVTVEVQLAHQTSEAEVPGSNPSSPTTILMRCRIIVNNVEKSQGREGHLP